MVFRADGGIYISSAPGTAPYDTTKVINTTSGAYLSSSGDWVNASSATAKTNIVPVDGQDILEKINSLKIGQWTYITDNEGTKHIGPTSEDFYTTFGVGRGGDGISTVDPAGIALVAIQELYRTQKALDSRDEEIDAMKNKVNKLEAELKELREMVERSQH